MAPVAAATWHIARDLQAASRSSERRLLLIHRARWEGKIHTFLNAVARYPAELRVCGGAVARPQRSQRADPVGGERYGALECLPEQLNGPSGKFQKSQWQIKNPRRAAGPAHPFHIFLLP